MNGIAGPDYEALYTRASTQAGYFTTEQAREHGVSWRALSHHAARGRFRRVRRGLYRFRDYPSSLYEEVVAAWLAVGPDRSVLSHDTALDIYDLTDIIPSSVHLIVPRAQRGLHPPAGVTLHTTTRPLRDDEVTIREGVRLTTPERTLLDMVEADTALEHTERGIQTALARGWLDAARFHRAAQERGPRVGRAVVAALGSETRSA
jgi:predicted transcriptional regulator of viral defense system